MLSGLAYPVTAVLTTSLLWLGAAGGLTWWGRRPRTLRTADLIVVPGCPTRNGTASPALQRRVDAAVALFERGLAPTIVVSGHQGEADAGLAHAHARGVPHDALVAEPRARSTRENAAFVAQLLPSRSMIVVSDDYHLLRCHLLFGRHVHDLQVSSAGSSHLRMSLREVASLLMAWRRSPATTEEPHG